MSELTTFLTGIADAIRSKKSTNESIPANKFAEEISTIVSSVSSGSGNVKSGTFAIPEDCEEYTFSELDFTPDIFLICAETMGQGYVRTAMWLHSDFLKLLLCYKNATSVSVTAVVDSNNYTEVIGNSVKIKRYLTNNILAGNYKYIAIKK